MKITRRELRQIIIQEFRKYKGGKDNPCWPGHSPGGGDPKEPKTKIGKSGKRVANCKKNKGKSEQTIYDYQRDFQLFGDVEDPYDETELFAKQNMTEADPAKGTGKKPKGSGRRLYTDENPKDTVSVKFRTVSDIRDTLSKKSFKSKSHKRQSQIINLIHQRVRAAYKNAKDPSTKKRLKRALEYAEERKAASKKKTERLRKKK
tara:strand:+ start:196 stop:807 length:612 start_codon:yes stop_codon:yes gene_type:complete